MGIKTAVWVFEATNWRNQTQEDMKKGTKRKSYERN